MSYAQTRLDNDKRKNKPSVIFPIINTVLSAILLIVVIVLFATSEGQFPIGLFLFCLIILLMYPVASWLNSYVLKKMNLRKINNYEKETEMLIKYAKRYENYRAVEFGKEVKATFLKEATENIPNESPKFVVETCNFGIPQNTCILMTFGVSFAGLEIDRTTKEIKGVAGMLPRSIWYPKKLRVPEAKKAKVKLQFEKFNLDQKVVIHALKRADIFYDNKSGWLAVGERKLTILDEAYEISKNVILVLREQEIHSLWIKIDANLLVK